MQLADADISVVSDDLWEDLSRLVRTASFQAAERGACFRGCDVGRVGETVARVGGGGGVQVVASELRNNVLVVSGISGAVSDGSDDRS